MSASGIEKLNAAVARVYEVLSDMCDVFIDKDPLLSTEGSITVYYWFLRENGYQGNVRTFLVAFEQARRSKKEEYAAYNLLSRSTNDAGSLISRFEILTDFYRSYSYGDKLP